MQIMYEEYIDTDVISQVAGVLRFDGNGIAQRLNYKNLNFILNFAARLCWERFEEMKKGKQNVSFFVSFGILG
jgi:hypothetical protein